MAAIERCQRLRARCLSLTDQAIAFGNGNVTDEVIRQMLGLIDQADVIAILANIYQQNTQPVDAIHSASA